MIIEVLKKPTSIQGVQVDAIIGQHPGKAPVFVDWGHELYIPAKPLGAWQWEIKCPVTLKHHLGELFGKIFGKKRFILVKKVPVSLPSTGRGWGRTKRVNLLIDIAAFEQIKIKLLNEVAEEIAEMVCAGEGLSWKEAQARMEKEMGVREIPGITVQKALRLAGLKIEMGQLIK